MMRKKYNVFHFHEKIGYKTVKKYNKGPPINYTSLKAKIFEIILKNSKEII